VSHEILLAYLLLVDCNPLSESRNVRRYEQSSLVASILEAARSLYGDRSFAVGPSDMYSLELILWIAKMTSQIPHLINVGFFSRSKLSVHVPLENATKTIAVELRHTFRCCLCLHI
jgi:hypothetical protein